MCTEVKSALREGAPQVRNALVAEMENPTIPDDSKKRGQGDISGAVEEQPPRQHHQHLVNVAKQCLKLAAEKEAAKEASTSDEVDAAGHPKRVQMKWQKRYEQLVSYTVVLCRFIQSFLLNIDYAPFHPPSFVVLDEIQR